MSAVENDLSSTAAPEAQVSYTESDRERLGGGAVLPRTTDAMARAGLGAGAPPEASEVPRIKAEPRTIRFMAAPGAESAPAAVHLTNAGNQPFQIQDLALDDGDRSGFVVYGVGSDIEPGGTVELQIAFRPHARKTTSDRLRVIGNDGASAASISLRGTIVSVEKAQDGRASAIVEQARHWKYPGPPRTYSAMLDALTAAGELMDGPEDKRPDPFDYTHARELSEPVVRELDEIASHQRVADMKRTLGLNGVTQQVVDARIGHAKLAARTFMERAILGGSINSEHTLYQFRGGREEILLLTGEKRAEASELKSLDSAADTALKGHLIGYGVAVVAPVAAAFAVQAAPVIAAEMGILSFAATEAFAGVSTWALANPGVALELAGIAVSLGIEIGEYGIDPFLARLETPEGLAGVAFEILVNLLAVRQARIDGASSNPTSRGSAQGVSPGSSDGSSPTAESTEALAQTAVARLRSFASLVAQRRARPTQPAAQQASAGAGIDWKVRGEQFDTRSVAQIDENACGPACVRMVLDDRDVPSPPQDMIARAARGNDAKTATTGSQLVGALNQIHPDGKWQMETFFDLPDPNARQYRDVARRLTEDGTWIAHVRDLPIGGHWVLVESIAPNGTVTVRDPWPFLQGSSNQWNGADMGSSGTKYEVPWPEFTKAWKTKVAVFSEVER